MYLTLSDMPPASQATASEAREGLRRNSSDWTETGFTLVLAGRFLPTLELQSKLPFERGFV
jgi:hypothetical protein